jgi:hypothetical protein
MHHLRIQIETMSPFASGDLFLPVDAPFTVYKTDVKVSEWTLAGTLWKISCSEAGRITEVFEQNERDTVKTYKK